jgi:hypothetical protein
MRKLLAVVLLIASTSQAQIFVQPDAGDNIRGPQVPFWRQHSSEAGITQVHAFAQCGEDALRDYRLFLKLHDAKLRIRWSSDFTTPELQACR